jgi:hypothetical protein
MAEHKRATRKRGNAGVGLLPPASNLGTALAAPARSERPLPAGPKPAAQVYVSSVYGLVVTQNLMSRLRQVACSSHHAWYLLGTAPLRSY